MKLSFITGEVWYGGAAAHGVLQPYTTDSHLQLELCPNPTPNQCAPLLLSTRGRWLWAPDGLSAAFDGGTITCPDGTILGQNGATLRDAYLGAMAAHFPFHPCTLSPRLFETPVYNTWIELTFHQNQSAILAYAHSLLEHGLPPGVLMIDDGWNDYYGKWTFSADAFPDPAAMLRELHALGFSVMVWVGPFITPDSLEYRNLAGERLLVEEGGEPFLAHWWNGWSAVLDMTLAQARMWLKAQLNQLQALGVDGFKFDAGDSTYYPRSSSLPPDEHARAWARFGEQYPLNEFRVTTGAGGWSLMQRQCDKDHSWGDTGLAALIPSAIVQSLTGHPFLCPDMIGGGEYRNFYGQGRLDEELFVRWADAACLMPVMQFSAAPWRVLSPENFAHVLRTVELRRQWSPHLMQAIRDCARTGEPVLRPMAYHFQDAACACVTDQFTVGDSLLAAPILRPGTDRRRVYVPAGRWRHNRGALLESCGDWYTLSEKNGPILLEKLS